MHGKCGEQKPRRAPRRMKAAIRCRSEDDAYPHQARSSAAKTHLNLLDVIQRKAARIIYEVPRDAHAELLLLFLKLDALNDRRELHLVNLIKSFISGKCHPAMPSLVEAVSYTHLTLPTIYSV